MRDGVNLSRMQVTRPLVLATEIGNLPNLHGFLRFGRSLPVVPFRDRYNLGKATEPGFVERHGAPARMDVIAVEKPAPKRRKKAASIAHSPSPAAPAEAPDLFGQTRERAASPRPLGLGAGKGDAALMARSRASAKPHPADPA